MTRWTAASLLLTACAALPPEGGEGEEFVEDAIASHPAP